MPARVRRDAILFFLVKPGRVLTLWKLLIYCEYLVCSLSLRMARLVLKSRWIPIMLFMHDYTPTLNQTQMFGVA